MFGVIASGGSAAIDTSLVSEMIDLVKSVMGLFKEYPLNLMLIASLAGVAFGLVIKGKVAAKA